MGETLIEYHAPKPKIICVDFDGVLSTYKKGWLGMGKYGEPTSGVQEGMKSFRQQGWWVVVYTVRGEIAKIEAWLRKYGVEYDSINWHPWKFPDEDGRKVSADLYLDDRTICFRGDWEKTVNEVSVFKRWEE